MRLLKKLVLISTLCFGFGETAAAQYHFDRWTAESGLPQNSVYDIIQTRDGYIWLATMDGLVRFDGVRFRVFNKSNSPGISHNRFLKLYENAHGELWVVTEIPGLTRFRQGTFDSFGLEKEGYNFSNWISEDAGGNPVTGFGENELVRFLDGEISRFDPSDDSRQAVKGKNKKIFCQNSSDASQIFCYTGGRRVKFSGREIKIDNSAFSSAFSPAAQDDQENVWFITSDAKLIKAAEGKALEIYSAGNGLPGEPKNFVTDERLRLLSVDQTGAAWLTFLSSMQSELMLRHPVSSEIINSPALYEDREGNIWVGTFREGLYRGRRQIVSGYSKAEGLLDNNVYPIYQDRHGTIWIGTTNGIYQYGNGKFTLLRGTEGNYLNSIGEDASGTLLFSDHGNLRMLKNDRPYPYLNERIPGQTAIHAIFTDSEGTLWIGGEDYLTRFKDGVTTNFTEADGVGKNVKIIIEDKRGGLWIGTYSGLSFYMDGRFTTWTEKDGLPSRSIRALHLDSDGILWIGTYDGGLSRFDGTRFVNYDTKTGLFNDGAFQILEDSHHRFWISSNRGIYRVSRDQLNEFAEGERARIISVAYGRSDGMLNIECNGGRSPGGIKARDGRLWFPTQDGVAVIDPDAVEINPSPPPVVLEDILIDNRTLSSEAVYSVNHNPQTVIEITPDRTNFEIHYTALSFIGSENLRFRYRLEGLDEDWIAAGTRRTAYYSYVPPGEYTFRVIAMNRDGVWNEEGASVRIKVLPPFYKTGWFTALMAAAVLGLVFSVYKMRVNRLENARRRQEEFSRRLLASQEQERQRVASELHDTLGQSLLIMKNRIALAQADIDRRAAVEEQLEELSDSASAAIEECREIAYNLRPYQIKRFGLTETLYGIFMRISEVTDIEATAEIENIDELLPEDAQINLYRIVQESVNNVIKHSRATEAFMKITATGGVITVIIRDNGRGFTPGVNAGSAGKNGGFGLTGIAERVKMLGGYFQIDSAPGKGTSILITIK